MEAPCRLAPRSEIKVQKLNAVQTPRFWYFATYTFQT